MMDNKLDPVLDELTRSFQRDINCLTDEDRNIRAKGLNNINANIFAPTNDKAAITKLFEKNLLRNVLRLLEDKVGKHREIALDVLNKFIENIENIDHEMITAILKSFFVKFNVIPFPEQSEEMRLNVILTLRKLLKKGYKFSFQKNLADIAFMISKALTDQFPDVKKECSQLIIEMSTELKGSLGDHAAVIAKSIVKNFGHQHWKVRKITVEATGALLLTDNGANQMKELLPAIKIVVNDKNLEVRRSTYEIVANLLNGLSLGFLKDYESDLVQLLLNGLSDENEDVVNTCLQLISNVGQNIKKVHMEVETPLQTTFLTAT
jgi:hypothetical protein